jgi:hypothetical protein
LVALTVLVWSRRKNTLRRLLQNQNSSSRIAKRNRLRRINPIVNADIG